MKRIATFAGYSYAVSTSSGAIVSSDDGVTLCVVEAGEQGGFVAVGREVIVSDDAAKITCMSTGSKTGSGGGTSVDMREIYDHIDDKGIHVTLDEKAAWDAKPSEEEAQEIAAKQVAEAIGGGEVSELVGGDVVNNANCMSLELDAAHSESGVTVRKVRILARTSGSLSGEQVYLSVWEQVDGGDYELVAVSTNTQAQQLGEYSEWTFEGYDLHGKRMRYAALATPETPFAEASVLYVALSNREYGDTCIVHSSSNPLNYSPVMVLEGVRSPRYAAAEHVGDESHLQAGEREKWDGYEATLNKKVNSTTYQQHTTNAEIHVTAEEKEKWNSAENLDEKYAKLIQRDSADTFTTVIADPDGANSSPKAYLTVCHSGTSNTEDKEAGIRFSTSDTVGSEVFLSFSKMEALKKFPADLFGRLDPASQGGETVIKSSHYASGQKVEIYLVAEGSNFEDAKGKAGIGFKIGEQSATYGFLGFSDLAELLARKDELLALLDK